MNSETRPCRHTYQIVDDSGAAVTLKCRRCGKETTGEIGGQG